MWQEPELVSVSAIARHYGVSVPTAAKWTKAEGFPAAVRTSGARRWYLRRAVLDYFAGLSTSRTNKTKNGRRSR